MPLLPLFTLTLATFVIGSSELMIQGLLPEVAQSLGVAIPAAGLLVTAYALGVTFGSPLVTLITIRMRRKAALLMLMGVFAAAHALCAFAPDYGVLLAARVAASFCHGAFVALASVVAVEIAPGNRRAAAVSLVWSGFAASNILGVPAGTALGQAFGWRSTFWTVAATAAVSLAAMAALLPDAGKADDPRVSREFRALARPQVLLTLMLAALLLASAHSVFTFITPLLEETAGAVPSAIPGYLLAFGIGGVIGMQIGGRFADRNVLRTLIAVCAANVAVSLVLLEAFRAPAPALAMMFVWGFSLYFAAAPVQLRIVDTAREAPNLASTLLQSGLNAGIAAGPLLGAVGLRTGMTYAELPLIAAGLALAALAMAIWSAALDQRGSPAPSLEAHRERPSGRVGR
jgi:DHA1 family inner membrane transport protein